MRRPCVPYIPNKDGFLTMIHKYIYSKRNIQKISTSLKLTPYIQSIQILNQPIQSILLNHMYMATIPKYLHFIQDINNFTKEVVEKYPTNTKFLNDDFNMDIHLTGRTLNVLIHPSTTDDLH